jgi:hypothetical protein
MAGLRYSNVIGVVRDPEAWTTEIGRANASWGALENYTALLAFFLPTLRTWVRELRAVGQKREDEERWEEVFGGGTVEFRTSRRSSSATVVE